MSCAEPSLILCCHALIPTACPVTSKPLIQPTWRSTNSVAFGSKALDEFLEGARAFGRWSEHHNEFQGLEKRAMTKHITGTRKDWLAARLELLRAEKELTRGSDEL